MHHVNTAWTLSRHSVCVCVCVCVCGERGAVFYKVNNVCVDLGFNLFARNFTGIKCRRDTFGSQKHLTDPALHSHNEHHSNIIHGFMLCLKVNEAHINKQD